MLDEPSIKLINDMIVRTVNFKVPEWDEFSNNYIHQDYRVIQVIHLNDKGNVEVSTWNFYKVVIRNNRERYISISSTSELGIILSNKIIPLW